MSESTMRYTVIVEQGDTSWGRLCTRSAWLCRRWRRRERVLQLIREAIEFHVEGLRQNGEAVPEPHSFSELVEIDAA